MESSTLAYRVISITEGIQKDTQSFKVFIVTESSTRLIRLLREPESQTITRKPGFRGNFKGEFDKEVVSFEGSFGEQVTSFTWGVTGQTNEAVAIDQGLIIPAVHISLHILKR